MGYGQLPLPLNRRRSSSPLSVVIGQPNQQPNLRAVPSTAPSFSVLGHPALPPVRYGNYTEQTLLDLAAPTLSPFDQEMQTFNNMTTAERRKSLGLDNWQAGFGNVGPVTPRQPGVSPYRPAPWGSRVNWFGSPQTPNPQLPINRPLPLFLEKLVRR